MKITARTLLFMSLIAVLLSACKKDDPLPQDPDDPPLTDTPRVYAGVYDSTYFYLKFQPAIEVPISWDAQNLYGSGSVAIDQDNDGDTDFTVTMSLLNPDSLHLITGMPNPFPYCMLTTTGGLEFNYVREYFPIGLGQTGSAIFAARLDSNSRIDLLTNWSEPAGCNLKMWGENPGAVSMPSFGPWYDASGTYYLGIRMNGSKYGWIRVDASDPQAPRFISVAFRN
jgi:hypothetical protein